MKKCPTCERTFDDAMRFCQTDGTPLVAAAENAAPPDPFKTSVGRQEDFAAVIPPSDPFKTMVGGSFKQEESDDILQIPAEPDPLKTMYATDEEMKKEMSANKPASEGVIEIAPLADDSTPESSGKPIDPPSTPPSLPQFSEPNLSPPSFGENQPPPIGFPADSPAKVSDSFSQPSAPPKVSSPFDDKTALIEPKSPFDSSPYISQANAIPSPFSESRPTTYDPPSTPLPSYKEPEPQFAEPPSNPFNEPIYNQPFQQSQPLQATEWAPPPAPESNWQNQSVGANTPFQPPIAGSGQNQTLPIISLVLGIFSLCCYVSPLTGIAALITGYLGMKNANNDPANYGGKTMAIVGMALGGLFLLIGIVYWILILIVGFAGLIPPPQ